MKLDVHGKTITIMGLGVHGGGLGVAQYLAAHGAHLIITDLRSVEQLAASLEQLQIYPNIHYRLGEHAEQDFTTVDMVIRNPGVPQNSYYLQLAAAANIPIEMEMSLFFRLCPAPIIAITGTKGKTTTTMLAGAIFQAWKPESIIAGNMRISAMQQLDHINADTPVILELSSWQLEGLGAAQLSPDLACITNFSPDHMDRYTSLDDYATAKKQIYLHQTAEQVVLLPASAEFDSWAAESPSQVHRFSPELADQWPHPHLIGMHNNWNVAAASEIAKRQGVPDNIIRQAIASFSGVEHRMEVVRIINNIRFINDTAATTPTAAAATLQSIEAPTVLIAGGANKNLSWQPLIDAIEHQPHLRGIILLEGTATAELNQDIAIPLKQYTSFEAAIKAAYAMAQAGDTILLAPGAASFGMFKNEFHRGEEFRRIVKEL